MSVERVVGAGHSSAAGAYGKPQLQRLGTFRELTLGGGSSFSDMWTTDGTDGCVLDSSSSYTCYKG